MTRTEFLTSNGFDCANWMWSWSFINHESKQVAFAVWEDLVDPDGSHLILHDSWKLNQGDKPNLGYLQAIEHLNKALFEGYVLVTFDQEAIDTTAEVRKVKSFKATFDVRYLLRKSNGFYVVKA